MNKSFLVLCLSLDLRGEYTYRRLLSLSLMPLRIRRWRHDEYIKSLHVVSERRGSCGGPFIIRDAKKVIRLPFDLIESEFIVQIVFGCCTIGVLVGGIQFILNLSLFFLLNA